MKRTRPPIRSQNIIHFGKYQGKKIQEVPEKHLCKLLVMNRNGSLRQTMSPALITGIRKHLNIPDWMDIGPNGNYSHRKRLAVLKKTGFRCGYCGKKLHHGSYVLDHIFPKIRGGGNNYENLLACCRRCNSMKHDKTIEQFWLYNACTEAVQKAGLRQKQLEWLVDRGLFDQIGGDPNFKFFFQEVLENATNKV